MTSSNEARTNREYLTCLVGGGIHSWVAGGLDVIPREVFPRSEDYGTGLVLCATRRCVWCGSDQASVYRRPFTGRWKAVP